MTVSKQPTTAQLLPAASSSKPGPSSAPFIDDGGCISSESDSDSSYPDSNDSDYEASNGSGSNSKGFIQSLTPTRITLRGKQITPPNAGQGGAVSLLA